ncbi:MAG: alpha/beta fold hydrolase [Leptolyngbyaceae bacterium]|nr:alpha/beta fold hydrolase [Leptolyngbyaceae bacterium]
MTGAIAPPTPSLVESYWQWQGHRIHYVHSTAENHTANPVTVGNAPPSAKPSLLLVHGFGASTDHWRKNIAELKANFDVWAIDLLGFGRSAKPEINYSSDVWCRQLHDFITEKVGNPVVLVGNSLGGYASLCVAAQYPQSVQGVVLLNSAGPFSDALPPQPSPALKATWQRLVRSILLHPLPSYLLFQYTRRRSVIRKTLTKVYFDPTAVTDQLVEDIYRPSCDPGAAKVFAAVFKAKQGEPVDQLLAQMRCPLLTIWGSQDPWMKVHERGAKFRQHYADLTEHYLKAGHCPHDEVPQQVNQLLSEWVEAKLIKSS